jgi:hypothetical protein
MQVLAVSMAFEYQGKDTRGALSGGNAGNEAGRACGKSSLVLTHKSIAFTVNDSPWMDWGAYECIAAVPENDALFERPHDVSNAYL